MKLFILFWLLSLSLYSQTEVITYNLSLDENRTKHASIRRSYITDYLYHSGAHVLCLQEVYTQKDREYIIDSLKDKFPFSFYSRPRQKFSVYSPACKTSELFGEKGVLSCLWSNCLFKNSKNLGQCFKNSCPDLISPLVEQNRTCAESVLTASGKINIFSFLDIVNPFYSAPRFSYQGSNGLLILSKNKIMEQKEFDFGDFSSYYKRGSLFAKIDDVSYLCTQLSSDLKSYLPYMGKYKSYKEENERQVEELIKLIPSDGPVVVLGNLNCSLEHKDAGISFQNEKSCQEILKLGFKDQLYDQNPECTYCASNNLITENRQDSLMLDHIYTKDINVLASEVRYKNIVEFNSKEGSVLKTQLSTNHGVWSKLETKP